MNYCEKIPSKTSALVLSGKPVKVDCLGLEATVYAKDSDIYIKCFAETSNDDAFILGAGSCINLCGSFWLDAQNAEARILFCRVL